MSARHTGDCADHRLPSAGGTEPTCCTLRGNLLPAPSDGARLCGGARRLRPILQEGYNSGVRLPASGRLQCQAEDAAGQHGSTTRCEQLMQAGRSWHRASKFQMPHIAPL